MPVCAIAKETADGLVLVLDPTQPNPHACSYVVETGSESVIASLGSLSIPDAMTIGAAIWALWALCWGIKQVGRAMFNPNEGKDDV